MQVEPSGVSGEFPLAPTTTVTETLIAEGYEITVAYSITPEENYAGPPGNILPTDPVS
jgi:hypothetical protein